MKKYIVKQSEYKPLEGKEIALQPIVDETITGDGEGGNGGSDVIKPSKLKKPTLSEKFDTLSTTVDKLSTTVDKLADTVTKGFISMNTRFDGLEARVTKIENVLERNNLH